MHTPSVLKLALGFIVLAAVFGALERLFPALPGVSIWRRDRWPDFLYWFFTPLVTRVASSAAVALALVLFGLALGNSGKPAELIAQLRSGSALARQPPALQLIEALLVADFFGYWMHRAFHGAHLWRFHAVHHSARMLDWLAATRLHPVNDALSKIAVSLPLILLGFDLKIFAAVVPVLTFYAIFEHANVPWSFGPLRFVVATPLFHRWHHTAQSEGLDKNFAGLFPLWDALFGTLWLPRGRQPEVFGVPGNEVPEGFLRQLAYPWSGNRRQADRGRIPVATAFGQGATFHGDRPSEQDTTRRGADVEAGGK